MKKTLFGLGLALTLIVSGCSGGGDGGASPTPMATTASTTVHPGDVASVDLTTAQAQDRAADGSGAQMSDTVATIPSDDVQVGSVQNDDEVSLAEAKTGEGMDEEGLAATDNSAGGTPSDANGILTKALEGNLAEQELSGLAVERSDKREIQDMARMIANDHRKAEEELRKLGGNGLPEELALSPEHEKIKGKLEGLSGAKLDRAYVDAMVKDHEKTLAFYRDQSKNAPNEQLKNYFTKNTPVIEKHLEHCRHVQESLG